MASFKITAIQATPNYSTQNRNQQIWVSGSKQIIWSTGSLPDHDGSFTGSVFCTTFNIPATLNDSFQLGLNGLSSGIVLQDGDHVQVTGRLNGTDIIRSTQGPFPSSPLTTVVVPSFRFLQLPKIPVRLAGDWSWTLGVVRGGK
jgi:hypothetical protein